jgi:hypothetical protein
LKGGGVKIRGLASGALLLCSSTAFATSDPRGSDPSRLVPRWSVGLERFFGISHSWDAAGSTTSAGLGLEYLERTGHDTARIAVDHVFGLGLSLGAGLGYAHHELENELGAVEESYWVLAPRAGFWLQPWEQLALWPRAGVTLLGPGGATAAAITLELPLVWRLSDGIIGLSAAPHLDIGLTPTNGEVSALGLCFGANLFF